MLCTGLTTGYIVMNQKIDKVAHEIYSLVKKMNITNSHIHIHILKKFERLCEQCTWVYLLRIDLETLVKTEASVRGQGGVSSI